MGNNSEYISLQEVTQYCNYSQEYLSLRARQGKLKAVKFGRNWVTKKEWLEEYLKKAEEYNNFKTKNFVAPPENLPVEAPIFKPVPLIRFGFIVGLVFVLLVANCVFGKESFKNVYRDIEPYTYIVGGAGDIIVESTLKVASDTISDIPQSLSRTKLALVRGFVTVSGDVSQFSEGLAAISLPQISMPEISLPKISVREWFGSQTEEIVEGISAISEIFEETYFTANELVEEKISKYGDRISISGQGAVKGITQRYWQANDFLEKKISQTQGRLVEGAKSINEGIKFQSQRIAGTITKTFKAAYRFITQPWRLLPEKIVEKVGIEEIEELRQEIKELKEEGIPAKEITKEVTKITKVEPVKEITKETIITKIDEEELTQLKTQIAEFTLWGADIEDLREITKKLQAHPTYVTAPTAPIYIASQGLQVGGTGTFASLGVSGLASVGQGFGVGGSTNLGSTSSDVLTVNATAAFKAPVAAEGGLTVGTGTLAIDTLGNLTTTGNITTTGTGNLTVAGDLTVAGTQTFTGAATFSGNLTTAGNLIFDLANDVTIQVTDPAAARTYIIPDFGADDTFVSLAATQVLTNKTYEGLTLTSEAAGFTIAGGTTSKTLTVDATQSISALATLASPTFTGTVTIPSPFTLGATSVTATGTQLNYLNAAAGTTGTTSTNLVFSTSPILTTPNIGAATATSINNLTITSSTGTLTIAAAKIFSVDNTLTLTATDGSTLAIGTGGILGSAAYTASSAYEVSGAVATHAALTTTHGVSGAIVGTTDIQTLTNKTYEGLSITTTTGGILTISDGKTFSVDNTLALTATDGSTLAIGTGGILGSAAYTASSAYEVSGAVATHAALTTTHGVSGAIVGTTDIQTLTNKSLVDASFLFIDDVDNTKKLAFQLSDLATATTRTLTIPDVSGTVYTSANDPLDTITEWQTLCTNCVDIIDDTTGTLSVARGGTGATSLTINGVLLGQGTSAITALTAPTGIYKALSTQNGTVIGWNALESSHIPNLDASKITSGRFGMTRMPDMALDKIMVGQGATNSPIEEDKPAADTKVETVSDALQHSNDAEKTTASPTMVKMKETKMGEALANVRVKFDFASSTNEPAVAQVYKNGIAIGIMRGKQDTGYVTYSEDFAGFATDDLIQIYGRRGDWGAAASKVKNFRFCFDNELTHIGGDELISSLSVVIIPMTNQDP